MGLVPVQTMALAGGVLRPALTWVRPAAQAERDDFADGLPLHTDEERRRSTVPVAVSPLVPAGSGGVRHHRTPNPQDREAA